MTIEKSKLFLNSYIATQQYKGYPYVGIGASQKDAVQDLFSILEWNNIGDWVTGNKRKILTINHE